MYMYKKIFRKPLFIILILPIFLGLSMSNATGQKGATANKSQESIQVKLPDGVYFYKKTTTGLISPMVIVENGKLVDPYDLVNKIGLERFTRAYINEKEFTVYQYNQNIGKVSKISLKSTNQCEGYPEFTPNILGNGEYQIEPIVPPPSYAQVKSNSYDLGFGERQDFANKRIVITPPAFQTAPKSQLLLLTKEDEERVKKAFLKDIFPNSSKNLRKRSVEKKRKIKSYNKSKLMVADAFDLDGNGKKDFVSIYNQSANFENGGGISDLSVFVLNDVGGSTLVYPTDYPTTDTQFIGSIDVDQDGVQELIMQHLVFKFGKGEVWGKQIEILKYSDKRWLTIYQTKVICEIGLLYR